MPLRREPPLELVIATGLGRIAPKRVAESEVTLPVLAAMLDDVNVMRPRRLPEEEAAGQPVLAQVLVPEALHLGDLLVGERELAQPDEDVDDGLGA